MTDKLREAAQQALEALECCVAVCFDRRAHEEVMSKPNHFVNQSLTALRAALAEPPAEPVAIVTALSVHADGVVRASLNCELPLMMELYAAPQPKAEQPAEQEPVAWEWRWFDASPYTVTSGQWSEWKRVEPRNPLCTLDDALNEFRAYIANGLRYELRALYTESQPKREPLTDDEIDALELPPSGTATVRDLVRLIERAHGINVPQARGETK